MENNLPPPRTQTQLRLVLSFFLLLFTVSVFSQANQDHYTNCGTTIGSKEYSLDKFFGDNQKLVDILIENNIDISKNYLEELDTLKTMPVMDYKKLRESRSYEIPIKAWVYRNNNGSGNISANQVYQVVEELNSIYAANTNISFYLLCDIGEINNSNSANSADNHYSDFFANNQTEGALDVHFVISSLPFPNGKWNGIAYLPWQTVPYSSAVTTLYRTSQEISNTLAHEIGHNLGLRHTHDTARSSEGYNESAGNCYQEAVSRSKRQGLFCVSTIDRKKCEINGDGLCDTEADPGLVRRNRNPLSYMSPGCNYNSLAGGQDNWGHTWAPNVSNIMSYAPSHCRTSFSPLQVGKMYGFISGIGINYPSLNIIGPNTVCHNQTVTYSISPIPGATIYTWSVPASMTILNGQGTTGITVQVFGSSGGELSVTPNCGNRTAKRYIMNTVDIAIDGYDQACPLYTYTYTAPFASNGDYYWTVTNGVIISGQNTHQVQVKLNQNPSNQTTLELTVTNVCINPIFTYKTITHGDPPFPEQQCLSHKEEALPKSEAKTFKTDKLMVYPNPASFEVTVIPPQADIYNLILYDLLGRILFEIKDSSKEKFHIDTQSLPDGIYYIKVTGEGKSFTEKLILKK